MYLSKSWSPQTQRFCSCIQTCLNPFYTDAVWWSGPSSSTFSLSTSQICGFKKNLWPGQCQWLGLRRQMLLCSWGPCWEPGFTRDMPRRLPFAWKRLCSGDELEQPSCYRPLSIIRRLKAKEPSLSSNPEGRAATTYVVWKSFTDHLSLAKDNFTPGIFHGTRNQPPSLFVIIHLS